MLRDTWWWPWWVSSLIDVGVVLVGVVVFLRSRRGAVRAVAAVVAVGALVAAVLAPMVMTERSNMPMRNDPMMPSIDR